MKNKFYFLLKITNNLNLKKWFAFLLISSFTFMSYVKAQEKNTDFDIKWSNDIKTDRFYQNVKVLKADENCYYYFLCFNNGRPASGIPTTYESLIKYDRKTEKYKAFLLKLQTNGAERVRLDAFATDSAIHIISYFHNKKQKAVYLFDETVNLNTFESNNDIHKISEIKYEKKEIKNLYDIHIKMDLDELERKKNIKLFYEYKKNKGYIRGYEVFDDKLMSKAKYQIPYEENIGVRNYSFDNDFNLYVIERIFLKNKDDSFLQSKVEIACYSVDSSVTVRESLSLGNLFIGVPTLSIDKNNRIICAGLYSCPETYSARGGFSFIFNPKLKGKEVVNKFDFGKTFLTDGKDKDEAEKIIKKFEKCKEFEDEFYYNIHKIHHREDGGFNLIVEKRMMKYVGMDGRFYKYGDIYVLSFNADGSNKWIRNIIRKQDISESGINYFHFLGDCLFDFGKNDEVIVIYNALNSFNLLAANLTNESVTILTTIDKNGNQVSNIIFNDQKFVKAFCPGFSMNCGNGKYVVTKLNNINGLIVDNTFNIGELTLKLDN